MKSLLAPTAASAMPGAAGARAEPAVSEAIAITRNGTQASIQGSAEYFTGRVRVDPLFQPQAPARTSAALVTFEPGARTAWHTHPLGQTLIVTSADSALPGIPGMNPSNASPQRATASRIDC